MSTSLRPGVVFLVRFLIHSPLTSVVIARSVAGTDTDGDGLTTETETGLGIDPDVANSDDDGTDGDFDAAELPAIDVTTGGQPCVRRSF